MANLLDLSKMGSLGHSPNGSFSNSASLDYTMPPRVKLDFYYDIGSSYSYLAHEVLLRYENLWNLDLELKPVSRQHLDCHPVARVFLHSCNRYY